MMMLAGDVCDSDVPVFIWDSHYFRPAGQQSFMLLAVQIL